MLKLSGRVSLASVLVLLGTSPLLAQGSFILGADDWTDWGSVVVGSGPWSNVTVNETEANDDHLAANAVAVGDDYAGSIDAAGADYDYASFTVPAGGGIVAETVDVGGLDDTTLTLYDTDGVTELVFDDDGGHGLYSLLLYTFTNAGTYFLKVGSYGTKTGAYSMQLRMLATVPDGSWVYIQKALEAVAPGVTRAGHDGSVAVLGAADSFAVEYDAGAAYHYCVPAAAANSNLSGTVTFHEGAAAMATFFSDLGLGTVNPQIIVLSGSGSSNDMDPAEAAELTANASAIAGYINSGGGLIAHGDDNFATSMVYDWLPTFIPGASVTLAANSPTLTNEGQFNLPAMDDADHYDDADGYFENHGLDVYMTAPGDPVGQPGTGNTVNELEGNDDYTTANAMVLGDDAAGDISVSTDVDYFSFSANAGDVVRFETVGGGAGGTLGDTTLALYDTDGVTELAYDDDGGAGYLSLIDYTFSAAGTYFIMADNFISGTGTYILETRFTVPGPDQEVIIGRLPSAWNWLGNALAGVNEEPLAIPTGTLAGSTPWSLSLTGAAPNTTAFLVFGLSTVNAPFRGGILVPWTQFIFALPTNGSGELGVGGTMVPTPPSGTTFYIQYWIIDAAGPAGFSASNALSGTTP